jgi:Integrase zinc binding domain
MSISADKMFLDEIKAGYQEDNWGIKTLVEARPSLPGIKLVNGLWYVGDRLVIPHIGNVCETLFRLAHYVLGHFGFDKTYASLRKSYYWPNMRKELETSYVPGCMDCQQNKSATSKPCSQLHPFPIPDAHGDSVVIDFIGPLLPDSGFNQITSLTDCLGSDICIIPSNTSMTAEELALSFFNNWYCENSLPLDHDKLFISPFWKALHALTSTKIKMSSSFHPETNSASERTNKTINQVLYYHVECNQKGWVKALPLIHFNIMNTINKSTGLFLFQLHMGRSAHVIPPLVSKEEPVDNKDEIKAWKIIKDLELLTMEAQDNLLHAKISQSSQANKNRTLTFSFSIGSRVRLSTLNRRKEFKTSGEKMVTKFMPRFDGPYTVTNINPDHSTVTLDLPNSPNIFPTFDTSMVIPYIKNDPTLFPNCEFS